MALFDVSACDDIAGILATVYVTLCMLSDKINVKRVLIFLPTNCFLYKSVIFFKCFRRYQSIIYYLTKYLQWYKVFYVLWISRRKEKTANFLLYLVICFMSLPEVFSLAFNLVVIVISVFCRTININDFSTPSSLNLTLTGISWKWEHLNIRLITGTEKYKFSTPHYLSSPIDGLTSYSTNSHSSLNIWKDLQVIEQKKMISRVSTSNR